MIRIIRRVLNNNSIPILIKRSVGTHLASYNHFINVSKLEIEKSDVQKEKTPLHKLEFGKTFSDHMLEIDWDVRSGWGNPIIKKYGPLNISPASSSLHYGLQCFEGMKAYKDKNGEIRLFRPDLNMERMNFSMNRLAMPKMNPEGLIECIKELLKVDESWIPQEEGYSMYIRPTAIGTSPFLGVRASDQVKVFVILSPVGPYYPEGFKPIKLFADTKNIRAWPGGVGNAKVGGNYGASIEPSQKAASKGYAQVLWLFGKEHQITEVGAMNIFFLLKNKDGTHELTTAPLDRGDILPGVTRRSILELARGMSDLTVSERWLTMPELLALSQEGRILEAFGAGTAAVIAPVKAISYDKYDIIIPTGEDAGPIAKRMWNALAEIQYGKVEHDWSWLIKK